MSSNDRPATKAFKDRWNNLLAFWKERRRGPYDRDFTEWRIEMGLTPRTAKENYWDAGEILGAIKIVFEKRQKFWEYCNSTIGEEETATEYMQRKTEEKKPELSAKSRDFFEQMEIMERMRAGPCKDKECPPFTAEGCRYCGAYISYTGKFEEPEENEYQRR